MSDIILIFVLTILDDKPLGQNAPDLYLSSKVASMMSHIGAR